MPAGLCFGYGTDQFGSVSKPWLHVTAMFKNFEGARRLQAAIALLKT